MSKPGYVSVSLPNELEHNLQQIGDEVRAKHPNIIHRPLSRVAIIEFLINYYNSKSGKYD